MASTASSPAGTLIAWLAIAVASFAFAGPQIEALGLYYDEAFMAQQARDFTEPARAAVHPPSVTTGELFGRPFPIRNAAYLGSLKSQLAIPGFALFGATKMTLRYSTMAVALLGLLLAMLAARRVFDDRVAIAMGVLVASDPAFHFFSHFEWGPFTSLFLCRAAGVWLLLVGVARRSTSAWIASAVCFGLGVYSRVDFAVILAGYALALLVVARPWLARVWKEQRPQLMFAGAGFAVSLLPVAVVVADVLGAGGGITGRGDLAYRAEVLLSILDGSHFARLLEVGGRFEAMFVHDAVSTVFPAVFAACLIVVAVLALRGDGSERARVGWLVISLIAIAGAMLAIGGAVRAHHMLNIAPLPQLVVAAALVGAAQAPTRSQGGGRAVRALAAITLLLCVASNVAVLVGTADTIHETRGTGRFSHALEQFAIALDGEERPGLEVVALDWGFHEPVHFSTTKLESREPIWKISQAMVGGKTWEADGGVDTIYLMHEGEDDLFRLGEPFARLVRIHREHARVEEYRDGRGDVVFESVRFDRPHTLSYAAREGFRLRWREAGLLPPSPVDPQ